MQICGRQNAQIHPNALIRNWILNEMPHPLVTFPFSLPVPIRIFPPLGRAFLPSFSLMLQNVILMTRSRQESNLDSGDRSASVRRNA